MTPFAAEYYADRFQNISYRWTVGAGAGVYIARRGDLEWRAILGGSYRTTKYLSVEAGVDDTDDTGAISPGTFFDMDVTDDLEVSFEYSAQVGVPNPKETTHHAEFLGSLDLIGDIFELTLSVIYDRVENPKADSAGIVPKRDDVRLVFGFGVDL